jgi:predicted nucleic acid-binding protein
VVDASVLAAIALSEDGSGVLSERLAGMARVCSVPFCRFEVANALWKARSLSEHEVQVRVEILFDFPLDEAFPVEAARAAMAVARRHRITFYDAAYIALARQEGLPLWTLDRRQSGAARGECELA